MNIDTPVNGVIFFNSKTKSALKISVGLFTTVFCLISDICVFAASAPRSDYEHQLREYKFNKTKNELLAEITDSMTSLNKLKECFQKSNSSKSLDLCEHEKQANHMRAINSQRLSNQLVAISNPNSGFDKLPPKQKIRILKNIQKQK